MPDSPIIWYPEPARHWERALPLGNGRLGAMVYGRINREIISLNEDSLWSGYPRAEDAADRSAFFRLARESALSGQYGKAQREIESHLLGRFSESYLPLCDLLLDFTAQQYESGYTTSLDLSRGLHACAYRTNGANIHREAFVSHPDQAMFYRVWSDGEGQVSFSLRFDCQLRHRVGLEGDSLVLRGLCPSHVVPSYLGSEEPVLYSDVDSEKGMRFFAAVTLETAGGQVSWQQDSLTVTGADEAVIRFTARTSFNGPDRHPYLDGRDEAADCRQDMKNALKVPYPEARRRHIADFSALFDRVRFDLGPDDDARLNTARRLEAASRSENTGLMRLLFHFGRYLMISASRPGTQASNLQGIWSKDLRPIWSSNYTININTQMNYWPAEPCNLSELQEPLFRLVGELALSGRQTAKALYGAGGAVSHHNTDLWRLAGPVGEGRMGFAGCAFFPASLAWLSAHLMAHYRYTEDAAFLKETALPVFREVVRFLLDMMATDPQGRRFVSPATSPENVFLHQGKVVKVAREATINNALVREALRNYLDALTIAGIDEPMRGEAEEALLRVPGYRIGSRGQLLEWDEEFEEPEPDHRHVSHLYGLFPGDEITPEDTPELALACKRSLELRGKGGTGWSLAWKTCLWARLYEGDLALESLQKQLRLVHPAEEMNLNRGGIYYNLFSAHPPFQIDGNFGITAGIAEMLLQNRKGRLILLPALPKAWPQGSVQGLKAHRGMTVDIAWENGALQSARLQGPGRLPLEVAWQGRVIATALDDSGRLALTGADFLPG